ncbi:WD40 repeat-like protein [Stereum hirsutum FP-91666 SS1]|uniref:WD40 repeat-like protein n=1 Tax=Stereum hirsutum (strain FP-91666) TaxID=721885 RepID=UPI000444A32D|nr:WD40 repeat-like protein [Stereum hirsutum FP-91666 SS1]EIM80740.1 WD40 repeat-like protein [Stereum hirsutum FP-91666 SS1]
MAQTSAEYTWAPPSYDVSSNPLLGGTVRLTPDPSFSNNFVRSAKWCPDGSMALAHCENRSFQMLNLPPEILHLSLAQTGECRSSLSSNPELTTNTEQIANRTWTTLPQAAPIVDYAWYPRATVFDLASFCFVASVRESPVRLLDAASGRLRASYKIVDHRERQIAPHSLAFNLTGQRLYCGFDSAIEVFDLQTPGEGTRILTTPSRKSRDGLKGILSALSFCPSGSFFAAGSLSPPSINGANIALFNEDDADNGKAVGWIGFSDAAVRASVSQIAFHPYKPHILYASFRRHTSIYAWDLRGDTFTPVQVFDRSACASATGLATAARKSEDTNQRLKFDVDIGGKWMSTGTPDGDVCMFDLDEGAPPADLPMDTTGEMPTTTNTVMNRPALRFHAHEDAIGSTSFHPLHPFLLSVSGSRHFDHLTPDSPSGTSSSGSSCEEDESAQKTRVVRKSRARKQPETKDDSIRLWDFSGSVTDAG